MKDGKLSCCGITETLRHVETANKVNQRSISRAMSVIFDPVVKHYEDDGSVSYEGLLNEF